MSNQAELILFDVDGTLLDKHSVTRKCMKIALRETFGSDGPIDDFSMSGKTDMQIMRELMMLAGIERDEINSKMQFACKRYVEVVLESISMFDIRSCIGIPQLLEALHSQGIVLGLLTGNLEGIVAAKLTKAGLQMNVFSVGAFGSDAEERDILPLIAIERAEKQLKRKIEPYAVLIVGDTPLDIQCARATATRVVAVATGNFSVEALKQYHPDYLFKNFSDLGAVLSSLNLA